ncbi:hypothetical protein [Spirosoma gilvum]
MPYLTKNNSLRIISQVDFNKVGNLNGNVYKKPIYFLSDYEKNRLLGLEELFKDPDRFLAEYYIPIDSTDHLRYVYEGGKPAYHATPDCDRLNSNFRNFEIPEEIRERGRDEVIRFRDWFKRYQYLLDIPDVEAFTANLYSAFRIQINPKAIDYSNSGSVEKENLNLTELEHRIDQIISDAGSYFNCSTDRIKKVLRRFQKYTFLAYSSREFSNNDTGMTDEELREFLKRYDTDFKMPLKNWLVEYYRVKHNPNLKFEGHLLEQLGFKPCAICYGQKIDAEDVKEAEVNIKPRSAALRKLFGLE